MYQMALEFKIFASGGRVTSPRTSSAENLPLLLYVPRKSKILSTPVVPPYEDLTSTSFFGTSNLAILCVNKKLENPKQ